MTPLAESMRPTQLQEVVGQSHLIGEKGIITKLITNKTPISLLLWGPPGSGKTTLARIYAKAFDLEYIHLSAIASSTQDIKKQLIEIERSPLFKRSLILFLDEIHRFNRLQQDVFLPYVEKGLIFLIGATTENPSFTINPALLSRLKVIELRPLSEESLMSLLFSIEKKQSITIDSKAKEYLIQIAGGDARALINRVESILLVNQSKTITVEDLLSEKNKIPYYDKNQEFHYQYISALHKAIRGSDPQASLYWLARMLAGGEDGNYIARRLIRVASEDIGLADPQALQIALQSANAYHTLGSPEGELALAQAVVYLSLAPKSNALYKAFGQALQCAKNTSHYPPPKHIINAPSSLMKSLGYGKNYQYDHETPHQFSGQDYFPEEIEPKPNFYSPNNKGFEKDLQKRIEYFTQLKESMKKKNPI